MAGSLPEMPTVETLTGPPPPQATTATRQQYVPAEQLQGATPAVNRSGNPSRLLQGQMGTVQGQPTAPQ